VNGMRHRLPGFGANLRRTEAMLAPDPAWR
jgi:hypothetical protein